MDTERLLAEGWTPVEDVPGVWELPPGRSWGRPLPMTPEEAARVAEMQAYIEKRLDEEVPFISLGEFDERSSSPGDDTDNC